MLGVFTSPVKVIAAFAIVLGWSFLQTVPVSAAQISRVVTTTADSGAGSLRQALLDANANATTAAAPHQITFNIPGGGVQTISLLSSLTGISQQVVARSKFSAPMLTHRPSAMFHGLVGGQL